ncbi:hypothetical protein OtV6_226c [Ostreococcus tauri virus RT-2011]|nr:hypothetical protein OtV6_226c [Ostreococcus tauri virus RT-2011]
MDLFHKLIDLVDKNAERIPEGDYVEMCNVIRDLRERVRPPSFLLDQNEPLWITDYDPARDGPPVYVPTTPGQPQEWIDEDSGLNEFLQELHEEWSRTDDGDETLSAAEAMGQLREHIVPESITINFVQ